MEVHAHTHTARKKWTHYFWEFLMLFLAVFCGFLAEYQLEHTIEHQREKKYAVTMLEDLKKDTVDLSLDIRWWGSQLSRIDTILEELDKTDRERKPVTLYRCASYIRRFNGFEYHDRTVEQLKNAGYFRLFRKKNVADRLMEYDARVRRTLFSIEEGGNTLYFNLNLFQNKIFDSRYFPTIMTSFNLDSLQITNPSVFGMREKEKGDLFEYANHLRYYKGNVVLRIGIMQELLKYARATIVLISREYTLN
ncbi:MAG TPA: hypothetical protein VJ765_06265 [Chitinophagaceae bacterium]|nr:hypothetical protein [Chitinophagaceae bacterium]